MPALTDDARRAWRRFHLDFEALRPELYRFCRHLTRSPWDAEDLVQDTFARTFVTLGSLYGQDIRAPRAWLFRVATHLWIDRTRRVREELGAAGLDDAAAPSSDPRTTREAAGTLIARLSPQERVALVLKEAFDLPLDDIAAVLATTTGAVKAALHRGRGKLTDGAPAPARVPVPAAIDAFCAAFNAGDLAAVTRTLLAAATVELPGLAIDVDVAASCRPASGILYHSLLSPLSGGVGAAFLDGYRPTPPRAEVRFHRGEFLVLLWYAHDAGEAIRAFVRLTLEPGGDLIAAVREYFYAPEALAEVAAELGVPVRLNGYGTEYDLDGAPSV